MYSLKLEWLHLQDKHITMCMSFKTTRAVGIKQAVKLQTDAARIRVHWMKKSRKDTLLLLILIRLSLCQRKETIVFGKQGLESRCVCVICTHCSQDSRKTSFKKKLQATTNGSCRVIRFESRGKTVLRRYFWFKRCASISRFVIEAVLAMPGGLKGQRAEQLKHL